MTPYARWLRMYAALKIVAAEGCSLKEAEARVWEKAVEEKTEPGVVGAVMNVLRESGPLKSQELFDAVKERYPGAAAQLEKRLEEAAALSERLAAAEDANGEAPSGASAPVETGGEAVAPAAPNDKELEDLFA